MNFKIENNYLHITNYPNIEKHFEEMASKGWLINKVIASNIFIYRKIEPEDLDFSISPYEVETEFTRKTKSELAEFQSVCESVGWNYATKSYDLHIYYKEKGSEALDIQTDEEEEFRSLEKIGKKYTRGLYMQIPMFLLLSWFTLKDLFTTTRGMKDGLGQLLGPMLLITVIMFALELFHVKRFLKLNKENIEMGESIKYSNIKFYYNRFAFTATSIFLFIFALYMIYGALVLNNKFMLIGLIPVLISVLIGVFYRVIVKPSKMPLGSKKVGLGLTLGLTFIIPIVVLGFFIRNIIGGFDDGKKPNIEGYKVLSINDFVDSDVDEDGNLRREASILIPQSYEYYGYSRALLESIKTEYSRALTEGIASKLVKRYKKEAEDFLDRYSDVDIYIKENIYYEYLFEKAGITLEEFNTLREKDIKSATKEVNNRLKERAITKDDGNLWNVDEAYFLNYNNREIVIRQGKEVFYLEAMDADFSDPEIIRIVKEKLGL